VIFLFGGDIFILQTFMPKLLEMAGKLAGNSQHRGGIARGEAGAAILIDDVKERR
jgi:hypothetical protein